MDKRRDKIIQALEREASVLFRQLTVPELAEHFIKNNEGYITDTGALMSDTGEFTGRSPKDKFIVQDSFTQNKVDWGDINNPISEEHYDLILEDMLEYARNTTMYSRSCFACNYKKYRNKIRIYTESAFNNLFCYNMFLRPTYDEVRDFGDPDWLIVDLPGFKVNKKKHGTRQHNFTIVDMVNQTILIGGSDYTGEMKKSIFSILHYKLPRDHSVLSMHCSANIGKKNDTAIFFGLSGTGKTTLSTDANRKMIGDDEHGWCDEGIFNFEGGCYAKCINLSQETEPEIFDSIRFGSTLENTRFYPKTRKVDFSNTSITQNTRTSYPLYHLDNIYEKEIAPPPKNIFFLSCDAFGVLPPISKLNPEQAMFMFLSGYTAKVAGTEVGIDEPVASFSSCFGKAFLPLHPTVYGNMLKEKLEENPDIKVWLLNTGWTGGSYGNGTRIKLKNTRKMLNAALNGELDKVDFEKFEKFNFLIPKSIKGIPSDILQPRKSWSNPYEYDKKLNFLIKLFLDNFKQYETKVSKKVLDILPTL